MPKNKGKPSRMTIDLSAHARKQLERVSERTSQSMSVSIRRAVQIYDVLSEAVLEGGSIAVVNSSGVVKTLVFPELESSTSP